MTTTTGIGYARVRGARPVLAMLDIHKSFDIYSNASN
jgi:hypothetical protein